MGVLNARRESVLVLDVPALMKISQGD
jgi:hypothetical protein